MNEIKKSFSKKAGVGWGTIISIVIVGMLFATGSLPIPMIKNNEGTWHLVWEGSLAEAAEANPGSGASGFLEIFFVNHTTTPTTTFLQNTSATIEGWCDANLLPAGVATHAYATADNFNLQLKHSTTFDIVIRVRYNKTHAWDGSKFIDGDTRVNITCAGFATMSDVIGTNVVSRNNTGDSYLYVNVFWQDADGGTGTGFTLSKGAVWSANTISIKIWAKY